MICHKSQIQFQSETKLHIFFNFQSRSTDINDYFKSFSIFLSTSALKLFKYIIFLNIGNLAVTFKNYSIFLPCLLLFNQHYVILFIIAHISLKKYIYYFFNTLHIKLIVKMLFFQLFITLRCTPRMMSQSNLVRRLVLCLLQ